jgi:hypothetical protein
MTDFPRAEAGLVDNFIGTAYDTVKKVYDTLPEIQRLDEVRENIPELAAETVQETIDAAMPAVREELDSSVELAKTWAEGTNPSPEDPTAKSAREWSEQAKADLAQGVVDIGHLVESADAALAGSVEQLDTKVAAAEAARDAAAMSGRIFKTIALGMAATPVDGYFSVPSAANSEYLILYQNVAGVATVVNTYPSSSALNQVADLVRPNETAVHVTIADEEDGIIGSITNNQLHLPMVDVEREDGITSLVDDEGGVSFYYSDTMTLAGHAEFGPIDVPGIYVVNGEDEVICDLQNVQIGSGEDTATRPDPLEGDIAMFTPVATFKDLGAQLFPQSMLQYRERFDEVEAAMSSVDRTAFADGRALPIDAAAYGDRAIFSLRDRATYERRRMINLSIIDVPAQNNLPIKVMMIGDSIGNRQGALFLKKYLEHMGAAPQFIGTFNGSALSNNSINPDGPLGECREGWETGDFTFAITDRVSAVAPGGEDEYLRSSKATKAPINPFIRAATGADDPAVVCNGWVFDPSYYFSRYSLDTPDVITITLGTNDVRDRTTATMYDTMYSNLKIMIDQLLLAAPNARIILSIPGTSMASVRNPLWSEKYIEVFRAFRDLRANLPAAKIVVAPCWAMCDHESGYTFSNAVVGADGFASVQFSDTVHPIGANRENLYKSLAPFVLAAKLNLI